MSRSRRSVWALGVAVVTSGLGVATNLATDLKDSWWAWLAVGALTVVSAGVSVWLQSSDAPPTPATNNEVHGTVSGTAIQAGTISGSVTTTDHSGPISQHATALDNATIQQAGRDITNPPPKN